ncbi:MAG: addiction module antidote protein [Alphaproteobacteria bacterium]|nr:putative addiction module antidote protein [Alphaproteobacteria bacterium]
MKKLNIRDFDIAEFLDSEEAISAYLSDVFSDGTDEEIKRALNNVARARNMSEIARKMGVSRPSLYKSLTENTRTEFSTIRNFLNAVGVQMTIVPSNQNEQRTSIAA